MAATNQITLTVDISKPAVAEAVNNLIAVVSTGKAPVKKVAEVAAPTTTQQEQPKKEQPAKPRKEPLPSIADLKTRVPAIAKASREANDELKAEMKAQGCNKIGRAHV